MASKLDQYRKAVATDLEAGLSDLQIQKNLTSKGCDIGRERLRRWIGEEQAAGRLPDRQRRNLAGRPKCAIEPSLLVRIIPSSPPVDTLLFLCNEISTTEIPELPLLFPVNSHSKAGRIYWNLIKAAGLPQDDGEEIDFQLLARNLGAEKVAGITELEFFLLAMVQPTWRDNNAQGTRKWIQGIALEALEIRKTMRQVVKLP